MIRVRTPILVLLFSGLFFLAGKVSGQDIDLGKGFRKDKVGMQTFAEAEQYFDEGNYLQALPLYRSLQPKYGSNDYLLFRIGICLLYKSDEIDSALYYLQRTKKKNSKAADIDLYLAHAYHLNEKYDSAITCLDAFALQKNTSQARAMEAGRLREYCINAKQLSANPVDAQITNIGDPVNTENSEYVPVISLDDSVMWFTYCGDQSTGGLQSYPGFPDSSGTYFEDVFMTYRDNGKWAPPLPLDSTINTNGHDACIGISNDGEHLLIYKDLAGNGDIYVSDLEGFYWDKPVAVPGEVNSSSWEGSATFSTDMNTIYFASEREGGYGGRDLWMATRDTAGNYTHVKNLGPTINTPFNEDAPFLHPNGTTLIFSSEGHNSMGGYDVFKTELTQVDSTFVKASDAENLGYPINTPGDDKYFVLGTDGHHGYYSSGKVGGMGQQDIYLVETSSNITSSNVMLLSGITTLDTMPVAVNIRIQDLLSKLPDVNISSNGINGKYLITLPQGRHYKITFMLDSFPRIDTVIAADEIGEMQKKNLNEEFFTAAYRAKNVKPKAIDTVMFHHIDLDSADILLQDPIDYNMLMRIYGDSKSPGLYFRVQIAAYNFPEHYNSSPLHELGPIDKIILDDKVTRFTMGKFETLREAEAYKQKIIAAGQTDAFITAEKDGKRYYLKELIKLHFFQK